MELPLERAGSRNVLPSILCLLANALFAQAGQAGEWGQRHEFHSIILGRSLMVHEGVFSPIEAEKQVLPYMRDHSRLFKGKTVLDVGTCSGIIALYAAQLGAKKVVATDISEAAVACARLNAKTGVAGGSNRRRPQPLRTAR